MSAPTQIIERALTFTFAQSISLTTGVPDVMEVAIIPLTDGNTASATYAGGLKTAEVELSNPTNPVVFELIPSNSPGLDQAINYRVMWRANLNSRTYTYDFQMPDADLTWGALVAGAGQIIDGNTYLQQTDLGVPNRVARLDHNGIPITSAGVEVALTSDITSVNNNVNVEANARAAAVAQAVANLEAQLATQVTSSITTAEAYTDNARATLSGDIATERGSRINADNSLQSQISTNLTALTADINSVAATIPDTHTLSLKADLVSGLVPLSELPTSIFTAAVIVPNQAAMLALSTNQVHPGDVAVRPDGVFLLNAADPTVLGNWVALSTVSSVNGYRGAVTLAATDVNAIPVGGSIVQSQVTGLATSLAAKANQTDMSSAQAAISAIQNDTTIVHTSTSASPAGTIPSTLLDNNMVYLNSNGQLTYKNGTVIPISGGGGAVFSVNGQTGMVVLTAGNVGAIPVGGSVGQGQVTGLSTTLTAKADLVSGTVPLAELPSLPQTQITGLSTALTNKADLVSGLIPLSEIPSLPQAQVTGLSTLLTGNQLTASTNAVNRISSLESQVATIGSGGGGGGGLGTQVPFYTSSNTTTAVLASGGSFTTAVNLHSPWGIDSDGTITGTVGTWYYLYTGVRGTDVAFPYISPNGHLQLHKWNEAGAADPVYALASDLATANTQIAARALETDLVTLQNTVNTKANASDLSALGTEVATKATTSALNALSTQVANSATSAQLATTNATVATLATQASVTSLTTTVGTKANQSALDTTNTNVAANTSALTSKADLVNGVLKATEIPPLAISNITGLATSLNGCATLTGAGSTVPLSQMPQNIPQNYVSGLGTTLGAKADLVNGVVPLSELPALNLPNVQVVANTAAMTALTTAQVGSGTLCLVTGGAGQGTYILTGTNPSQLNNWTELTTPAAPVTSVNGGTGTVVLQASDVGALAANASIPITQVTGLSNQLGTLATTTALTSGLAGKTAFADVQNMFFNSSMVKRADYVATTPLASLAGQQSVDGVLVPNGAIVLVTSQSSSVSNGLWVVNAGGSWARPADFATGSFLARDSIVVISNATGSAGGVANPYTIWQMSVGSGFIDTAANNWTRIGWVDPPFIPVAGNGIAVSGSTFTANVLAGGGVLSTNTGLQADPNVVARKYIGSVPSGSTVVGITHNLNTTTPLVAVYQTGSNTLVLVGVTVTSANAISLEFNSAPAAGQYNIVVMG